MRIHLEDACVAARAQLVANLHVGIAVVEERPRSLLAAHLWRGRARSAPRSRVPKMDREVRGYADGGIQVRERLRQALQHLRTRRTKSYDASSDGVVALNDPSGCSSRVGEALLDRFGVRGNRSQRSPQIRPCERPRRGSLPQSSTLIVITVPVASAHVTYRISMDRIALTFDDGPAPVDRADPRRSRRAWRPGDVLRDRQRRARRRVASANGWSPAATRSATTRGRTRDWQASAAKNRCATNSHARTTCSSRSSDSGLVRFRAPRYDVDDRVKAIAGRLGLKHTRGDVTPPDYDERSSAAFISTFVLQRVRPGAVVGLHDGVPPHKIGSGASRQATVDAMRLIVPRLRDRGFELVTASELLGA